MLAPFLILERRTRSGKPAYIQRLAESVQTIGRPFQSRFCGFAWTPVRAIVRGSQWDDSLLKSRMEIADVRHLTANDPSISGRRAHAIAELLTGGNARAISDLEAAAAAAPERAEIWSNLSATYLASAAQSGKGIDLGRALACADRALRQKPRLIEALFNRALAIENLGLQRQSEDAWRLVLELESDPAWAGEARQHLNSMTPVNDVHLFKEAFLGLERAAVAGDTAEGRRVVARFPQQTRALGEVETLGDWADAVLTNDSHRADDKLAIAEAIAIALRPIAGEELLNDAVTAIRREQHSASALRALAEAQRNYRQARLTYSRKNVGEAQPLFETAAKEFARAGSPMALVARYYVANTLFDQGKIDAARDELQRLMRIPALVRYRALNAQILWEFGLCQSKRGEWYAALTAFRQSALAFQQLGERANAGFLEDLIAETYDRISDYDEAWRHRLSAIRFLNGNDGGNRLQVTLSAAAYGALRAGQPDVGLSFLNLVIGESHQPSGAWLMSEAYVRRSMLHARNDESTEAARDIHDARMMAMSIADNAVRQQALTYASLGEAILMSQANPRRAVELLDSAASYYAGVNNRLDMPAILYQRGCAYRRLGNVAAASRDFDDAISELEAQRATIREANLRSLMFDGGADLFSDAIDLLLERGEKVRALEYVERSRARVLIESLALNAQSAAARAISPAPMPTKSIQRVLPAGSILIEFAVLRDRVAEFIVTPNDFVVVEEPIKRSVLLQAVSLFQTDLATYAALATVMIPSERLYDVLLRPVLTTHPGTRLFIVPGETLQIVPWAALHDRYNGRYLTEMTSLAVVPSATCLVQAQATSEAFVRRAAASPASALVFGDPRVEGMDALPSAANEAKTIGRMYPKSFVLLGVDATRDAFVRRLGQYNVVHFAGHANGGSEANALLFAGPSDSSRLAAGEIAELRLPGTQLVVLAACGTMFEVSRHVEWTATLAHAFLAAGVPAVVGTLWPIEDSASAELFDHFHVAFATRHDPAEALRSAQLRMISDANPRFRHPSSWAGAQLITVVSGARE
jgi:CHAT domain-containing protein